MLKRNFILQVRWYKSTLAQTLFAPLVFHLLLFALQQADYNRQSLSNPYPDPSVLGGASLCQGLNPDSGCITMFYTPNQEPYTTIMKKFASKNALRTISKENQLGVNLEVSDVEYTDLLLRPTRQMGIFPVKSKEFIYDYSLRNANFTKWAVAFDQVVGVGGDVNVRYQLWFNQSLQTNVTGRFSDMFGNEILGMVRGIDEAIIAVNAYPSGVVEPRIDVNLKEFPLIPATTLSDAIVARLGPVFFFCSEMVIFINVLNTIVTEKEQKLRIAMEMMGLRPTVFWVSQLISTSLLVFLNALITVLLGIIFKFSAFTDTNFFVLFLLFFLYGLSMVALAFFITTLVRKPQVSILIGIFIFVIGLLFENFVFSSTFVGYIWFETKNTISETAQRVLSFIPFFNFGKTLLDITVLTTGKLDQLTGTYIAGPGYPFSQIYLPIAKAYLPTYEGGVFPDVPTTVETFYMMVMNVAFYFVLTLYFDQVVPNEYGVCEYPWFFLTAGWWGVGGKGRKEHKEWLEAVKKGSGGIVMDDEDEDVGVSREVAMSDEMFAVKIVNLRKVFRGWFKSKNDKIAVKDTCLTLDEGKLLCLLGQNGAGKSTTMNILSGLSPPSKGDALIYGYSVRFQMKQINKILGVCPQHDILFADLTAVEHIELYAGLKGVPKKHWAPLIEDRLKCVKLWKVRNTMTSTFSGGMRRRLSMVISTIGDPKVIFMDEPTTGMDPLNRRHVWSFIEKFKMGRVIVMTTHSMEEADVLGDRIAIMAHGAIRAIGNSTRLKSKFGAGYRMNLVTEGGDIERVKIEVSRQVQGAIVEDESAGSLLFQFPNSSKSDIPHFVDWLENAEDTGVKAWGISQSTLEEVFLSILRKANPTGYSGYERHDKRKVAPARGDLEMQPLKNNEQVADPLGTK